MLLSLVTAIVFAAHLLAMNLAMAGPLLCVWLEWRSVRRVDPVSRRLEWSLARWSLWAFVAGTALAGALLGLLWLVGSSSYFAALETLPADRLGFAAAELVFYLVCQGWYCLLARRRWLALSSPESASGVSPPRRVLSRVLALAAASNLMYHFPALFAMIAIIRARPELWDQTLDRALYRSLLLNPEILSRIAHVWLAGLATAGVALMWLAARSAVSSAAAESTANPEQPPSDAGASARVAATGARVALAATLAQMPVGLWVLFELPGPAAAVLWNGDVPGLAMLAGGVALSMVLLQQLGGAAFGDVEAAAAQRCGWTMAAVVLLMCGTVDRLQRLAAEGAASTAAAHEKAQPGGSRAGRKFFQGAIAVSGSLNRHPAACLP